jgi:hypothetical protein
MAMRLDDFHHKQPHRPLYLESKSSVTKGRKEGPRKLGGNIFGPSKDD